MSETYNSIYKALKEAIEYSNGNRKGAKEHIFEDGNQTKLFLESINRGLSDSQNSRVYSTSELKNELKKLRSKKK